MIRQQYKQAQLLEGIVTTQFYGKDPDCRGHNCPAVFCDEETGDLYVEGETVTDPATLHGLANHSVNLPTQSPSLPRLLRVAAC
jgi:hypothetical protein